MPRVTIWIKEKNFPKWQQLENKSDFVNTVLEESEEEGEE